MIELFLDSGAYSAWTKKETIGLQDYIDFIYENRHLIAVYANLDDIESPVKTWENQREMEKQGLAPLPVYHVDEEEKYLHKAMEYNFFGVGGMALASSVGRESAFNRIFGVLCREENDYKPIHRIHGLGMTSTGFLWRFPWYSTDSGSWMQYSKYGAILYPSTTNQRFDYKRPPNVVFISERSPSQKEIEGPHFKRLAEPQQERLLEYIESKGFVMGKSHVTAFEDKKVQERVIEPGIMNDHKLRDQLNLLYFLSAEEHARDYPWPLFREGFHFDDLIIPSREVEDNSAPTNKVQIYFAGNFPLMKKKEEEEKSKDVVLKFHKTYRRLISYYYKKDIQNLLDLKQEELDES